jgi:2-dehydropantoate 2-reductase
MRFVVLGAGAVGGVVGGRLFQAGHDVTLVARGPHLEALEADGLTLESPSGVDVLRMPVAPRVADLTIDADTVVLLAVKSQDTVEVLDGLRVAQWRHAATPAAGRAQPAVVCLQNGVDNERQVLRRFARAYGVCVMLPASHLRPGVVQAHSGPVTGLLDIGCVPAGVDDTARAVAAALTGATFDSRPVEHVLRSKYRKLLMNLLNAVEALCGPAGRDAKEVARLVVGEGEAVLAAAGIEVATRAEDAERRGQLLSLSPTASGTHGGGSSWQSVVRGTGRIESDYLNGEICLLGRLHGVPTPVNARLVELAVARARAAAGPSPSAGLLSPEELRVLLLE